MWELVNYTPYAAERAFARDLEGAEHWLVAVRASYEFDEQGTVTLAKQQQPVKLAPEFLGDATRSALKYDSDLVFKKQTTDILLHGTARAPRVQPVTNMVAELSVGDWKKRVRVVGDRSYVRGGVSQPSKFVEMPLGYERAYGGPVGQQGLVDARNPIGTGAQVVDGARLPNLESESAPFGSDAWKAPVGFGPIPAHWLPRIPRAGTYDEAWEKSRKPLLPADFDERYFQCAPDDQQSARWLSGGELVSMKGFSATGELSFALPRVALGFETRISGRSQRHHADLHSVTFEPDERRFALVFHTSLRCHGELHGLRATTIYEKERL